MVPFSFTFIYLCLDSLFPRLLALTLARDVSGGWGESRLIVPLKKYLRSLYDKSHFWSSQAVNKCVFLCVRAGARVSSSHTPVLFGPEASGNFTEGVVGWMGGGRVERRAWTRQGGVELLQTPPPPEKRGEIVPVSLKPVSQQEKRRCGRGQGLQGAGLS